MNSYYEILGVNRNASKDEIKSAYIKALKKYHPDVYTGDEKFAQETTAKLNEIYDILKDDEKRKIYDNSLINQSQQTYYSTQQNVNTNAETKNNKENNIFSDIKNRFKINLKNKQTRKKEKQIKKENKQIKKENKQIKKEKRKKKQKISKKPESLTNKGKEEIEDEKINRAIYIILGIIAVLFLIILIF